MSKVEKSIIRGAKEALAYAQSKKKKNKKPKLSFTNQAEYVVWTVTSTKTKKRIDKL